MRRKSLGLSQTDLGAAVDLTFQQVQKYEKGKNRVSFSKLVGIAKALDCRVAHLIDGIVPDDSGSAIETENVLLATKGATELLDAYAQIPSPRLRRTLINVMKTMASDEESAEPSSVEQTAASSAPRTAKTLWRRRKTK